MYVAGNIICFRKACSYEVTTILRMLRFDMLPAVSELSLPLLSLLPLCHRIKWVALRPVALCPGRRLILFRSPGQSKSSTRPSTRSIYDNHIKNLFAYSMIEQSQSFKSIIVPLTVSVNVKFKLQNLSFHFEFRFQCRPHRAHALPGSDTVSAAGRARHGAHSLNHRGGVIVRVGAQPLRAARLGEVVRTAWSRCTWRAWAETCDGAREGRTTVRACCRPASCTRGVTRRPASSGTARPWCRAAK